MKIRFLISCFMSLILISVVPAAAHANMLSTSMILAEADRSARLEMVTRYMDREDVKSQMESLGVDPALAAERVAGLTDSQLNQLALNIESAPAGSGALGLVVVVLVILLLLELLGVTNIFKKV